MKKKSIVYTVAVILAVVILAVALSVYSYFAGDKTPADIKEAVYSGQPYVAINDNIPVFSEKELSEKSYEHYSERDNLGRCGTVTASIGIELMPTEERGAIGSVRPSGWQTVKYDIVDGKYLYNRCHLIGFQLSGENANEKNLITGTRYLNVEGMLPFENMVADYVKETDNHVAYRVTPYFKGDNLVAHGVQIEAYSIEDEGEGICFNVYCFNVQPGVIINYTDGTSKLEGEPEPDPIPTPESEPEPEPEPTPLVIYDTPTSKRYHYDRECAGKNARETTLESAQQRGLTPCKTCVE